mmetsp:Transcript_51570/g.85449  ORF Transcript_51570/g.85449 Transcript_51570/m.85449 type:complete len:231 (+) Transcript_51570:378-1070(+)
MFPSQEIYDKFKQLCAAWEGAAMTCMHTVLSEIVPSPQQDANGNDRSGETESAPEAKNDENDDVDAEEKKQEKEKQENESIPDGYEALCTVDDRKNIEQFGGVHSSISLIHYFNKNCEEGEEEKCALSEDEKLKNRVLEVPLDKHVDTGLMTLITCSDVAGLEVLDRKTNKYFMPEQIFDSTKHIFVIAGRKMELFTWKKPVNATWHAVKIPLQFERNSLLYFMEIQKDH